MSQNTANAQKHPTAVLVRVNKNRPPCTDLYSVIPNQSHRYVHLNCSEFTIGRDTHCQYTFDTLDVSRKHVMFRHDDKDGWKVIDLSSNGTWLTSDGQHSKLDKSIPTTLRHLNIITLKQCPELSYVFLENTSPYQVGLPTNGSISLADLSRSLRVQGSPKKLHSQPQSPLRPGVKRQCNPSGNDCTFASSQPQQQKRPCPSSQQMDDSQRQMAAIISQQCRLIQELKRKLTAQSKLFNPEDYTCSICLNIIVKPTTLVPCQHVFCHQCISQFREKVCSQRGVLFCPMCRSQPTYFFLNKSHQRTIDLILEATLTESELAERKQIEKDYCEAEKSVAKCFQTVQSEFMFNTPPVVLTDSNEIEEIEDIEEFFTLGILHADDDDDVDDDDDDDVDTADSEAESEELNRTTIDLATFTDGGLFSGLDVKVSTLVQIDL